MTEAFSPLLQRCLDLSEPNIPEGKRALADTVMSMSRLPPAALRRELRAMIGRCGRYDQEIAMTLRSIEIDLGWLQHHQT
jgi:hypothetical protein